MAKVPTRTKTAQQPLKPLKDPVERSFQLTSFIGGISDYDDKGQAGSFKGGSANLNIRRSTDSLYCNQALVDETLPAGTTLINFIVNCSDGNAYGFDDSGHVLKRTSAGAWSIVYTDPNGAILGAAEWYDYGGAATATITSSGTNVSNNDTITIGGQTYTFVSALTGAANQVLIGSSADASLANLAQAINNDATGLGSTYTSATPKNVFVSAGSENSSSHTLVVTALKPGLDGNSIGISKSAVTITLSGTTLSGGIASQTFLYWATATQLNRKLIPGVTTTPWTDVNASGHGGDPWPKTTLTSATWHTMREAQGDLMICNDHYLAMVGYDDSYTDEAVDLQASNIAQTVIERGDYAIAGTIARNAKNQSFYFSWQSQALDWINKGKIPAAGINAMIDTEIPLLQAGTDGQLFYSDFVNTLAATSFPGGGQVNPDAVEDDSGYALFGVYGNGTGNTGIYSYGRDDKNAPFVLNLEYQFDCDVIGSVRYVGTDLLVSYKHGATYGVKKVDSTTKAVATHISLDLKALPKPPSIPTIWTKVKMKTAALPAGTSIACYVMTDKSGTWVQGETPAGQTTFAVTNGTEAIFRFPIVGDIIATKTVLTPSGNSSPEVYKIEPFFV